MDADWLREELAKGRSLGAIACEAGRSPSTVAYWADKHSLTSHHAERHAARGGISEERLP
jgi:hypothetical protein